MSDETTRTILAALIVTLALAGAVSAACSVMDRPVAGDAFRVP